MNEMNPTTPKSLMREIAEMTVKTLAVQLTVYTIVTVGAIALAYVLPDSNDSDD